MSEEILGHNQSNHSVSKPHYATCCDLSISIFNLRDVPHIPLN